MFLIPLVRFLASEYTAYYFKLVAVIFSLGEIMPIYSYYIEKGLVCIVIIALFSCQPFSYMECIKLNMYLSCNIYSVSNAECIFFAYFYIF